MNNTKGTKMYAVTVVSPAGFRDTFNVHASNGIIAQVKVNLLLMTERPGWKATDATRIY